MLMEIWTALQMLPLWHGQPEKELFFIKALLKLQMDTPLVAIPLAQAVRSQI